MVEYLQEVLKEKVDRMTITYNKLVRDRIPEIIHSSGKTCSIEILSDEEYLKLVDAKLDEELAEYHKDKILRSLLTYSKWYMQRLLPAVTRWKSWSRCALKRLRSAAALKSGFC